MDDSSSGNLLLIAALLAANMVITMAYAALQNARQSELKDAAGEGQRFAQTALALLDAKSRLYITYNLTTTLLNFGMVLIATVQFVFPLVAGVSTLSTPAVVLIMVGLGLAVIILGDIVTEAIGSAYAMPIIRVLAPAFYLFVMLLRPATILLLAMSSLLARLFGSDRMVNTVTEAEIMTLVNAGHTGGTIEEEEKAMIYSILQLDETLAREMMVPRMDMVAMEINTSMEEAVNIFITTGFSRVPVFEENVDNIVGVIYAKDVLNLLTNDGLEGHHVRDLVRTAYFVPETRPADKLLRDLRTRNVHLAIVVDEYGGTSGLVTIENILEEIVGDIRDEYDINEEYEYIKHSDNEYLIDAGIDVDDFNELLGTTISSDETDTLGGYIYLTIGRVPIMGEVIEAHEFTLTIRSIEGRRIRKVLVQLKSHPDTSSPDVAADTETQQSIAESHDL